MTSKNKIKRQLDILINLAEQYNFIADLLLRELDLKHPTQEKANRHEFITNIISDIKDGIFDDSGAILTALDNNNITTNLEKGPTLRTPKISITSDYSMQVYMACNGGVLTASICEADTNTTQAVLGYQANKPTAFPLDIALAEVKSDELAAASGLTWNNQDIDIYLYGDVYDDDWTQKVTLKYDELLDATVEEVS